MRYVRYAVDDGGNRLCFAVYGASRTGNEVEGREVVMGFFMDLLRDFKSYEKMMFPGTPFRDYVVWIQSRSKRKKVVR